MAIIIIIAILCIVALFGFVYIFSRYFSRWFVAEVPLAVEDRINGKQSINRSWKLTKNSVRRIQGVVLIAFLVTLPLVALTAYIPPIFLIFLEAGSTLFRSVYFLSLLTSFAGGILVLPLWQTIKAVLYYDLRSRREGFDLRIRDSTGMRFLNRITLQTPESVELEFTLAGIGNRVYALLIDYLVWVTLLIAFFIFWSIFSFQILDIISNWVGSNGQIELWLIAIQVLVTFLIYVGYFVFFEALGQGQTPGKRFVKIRVIRDDGRPVGLQQSTLRALFRPVDDFFFLGAFLIVFGKREKRVGDWLAGTVVIQEEHRVASASIPVSQEAQTLANQLLLEADFSQMLPEDFAVVREYLHRRVAMIPKARSELSRQLAKQFKEVVVLESVPEGTSTNLFLEAVYLAYQQQS